MVLVCLFACLLTFDRIKKVEEGVIGNLFGNRAHSPTTFMLLLLLYSFHSHILSFVPIYLTSIERKCAKSEKKFNTKDAEMRRLKCGMQRQEILILNSIAKVIFFSKPHKIYFLSKTQNGISTTSTVYCESYPSQSMISGPSNEKGSEASGSDFIL